MASREPSAANNSGCSFILRGDFNDCANAGGGRGAKDEWCDSCKAVYGKPDAASSLLFVRPERG